MTARPALTNPNLNDRLNQNINSPSIMPRPRVESTRFLVKLQAVSIALTGLSFVSLAAVYGWNASLQKRFAQQYSKLETLKQTERELIVYSESLEHNLIKNIHQLPVKLIPEKPQQSIFITSAPLTGPKSLPSQSPTMPLDPIGY